MSPLLWSLFSAAHADEGGVRFVAGVEVGPLVPLTRLSPAFAPRVEAGLELPVWDGHLRWLASASWARPVVEGTGQDPRVPDGRYDYRVAQDELTIATGPTLRIVDLGGPITPELSAGPAMFLLRSTADGSAGGAAFGAAQEQYTRLGAFAAVGATLDAGPGELVLDVGFQSSALGGTITGVRPTAAVTPWLGYRLVL